MSVAAHTVHYMEIVTHAVESTRDFLAAVHGWEFSKAKPLLGNAVVAELADGSRCGIRAPMNPQERPIVRNYFRVDDVEAESKKAVDAGAILALPPTPLGDQGTVAIYIVGGVELGIWQLP